MLVMPVDETVTTVSCSEVEIHQLKKSKDADTLTSC